MEYRWSENTKSWHHCEECSEWPLIAADSVRIEELPANFKRCHECDARMAKKDCTNPAWLPPEFYGWGLDRSFSRHRLLSGAWFSRKRGPCPVEYRAHAGSDIWHFCQRCSQYPKQFNLLVSYDRPNGPLCDECQTLERQKGGADKKNVDSEPW